MTWGCPQPKTNCALAWQAQFLNGIGHIEQALTLMQGHWAAANSHIRTFFDALLDQIGAAYPNANLWEAASRRTQLAAQGFFSRDLNEWDDKGLGFVNGLAKRLHPHGSHPLSTKTTHVSLHTVLLTARLFLVRFDTWGSR